MIMVKNPVPRIDVPVLNVKLPVGSEQEPFIAAVDCHVKIDTLFAEVTKTFMLFNPSSMVMEGELMVPLPEDSILCKYHVESEEMTSSLSAKNGDGEPVEEAIRRRVGSGSVAELTGDALRIRVFPLPSLGWRTVSVTWLTELSPVSSRGDFLLRLGISGKVEEYALFIECSWLEQRPALVEAGLPLPFSKSENGWEFQTSIMGEDCSDGFVVRLPGVHGKKVAHIETRRSGRRFFSLNCPGFTGCDESLPWKPERIALLWDASGSISGREKEFSLLEQLLRYWQNVLVDLIVFRDCLDSAACESFSIVDGRNEELFLRLRKIPCDGATNVSSLHLDTLLDSEVEACFLLSDGLVTMGDLSEFHSPVPLHTICSSTRNHVALLKHCSRASGGHFYNLLYWSVDDIIKKIIDNRPVLTVLDHNGCSSVHCHENGGRVTMTGILEGDDCEIRLALGAESCSHTFSAEDATPCVNIAKQWAAHEAEKNLFFNHDWQRAVVPEQDSDSVICGTSRPVDQSLKHGGDALEKESGPGTEFRDSPRLQQTQAGNSCSRHLDSVEREWQKLLLWWEKGFSRDGKSSSVVEEKDDLRSLYTPTMAHEPEVSVLPAQMDGGELNGKLSAVENGLFMEWPAEAEYLKDIAESPRDKRYDCYLKKRAGYRLNPCFYIECGDYFLKDEAVADIGVRVVSNLLEIADGNPVLMRSCAYRLQQAGELDLAIDIFSKVLSIQADEPQSYRDLALVLGERWRRDKCGENLFTAMLLLWLVVEQKWDRFPGIELTALQELNRFIWLAQNHNIPIPEQIEQRFICSFDLDLRICLSWDAGFTDVDLHVYEPDGSHVYFGDKLSRQGGRISWDLTDGYGPEVYILRKAEKGLYTVRASCSTSGPSGICEPCTVMATLHTDYARENESSRSLMMRLGRSGDTVTVAEIEI